MPNPVQARKANPVQTRKARFRAALALAELTAKDWAEENEITPEYLSAVINGRMQSRRLLEKVDAFTRKYLKGTVTV